MRPAEAAPSQNRFPVFWVTVIAVLAAYYLLRSAAQVLLPFLLAVVAGFYLLALALLVLAADVLIPWSIEAATSLRAKMPEYLALARQLPEMLEKEAAKLPIGGEVAVRGIQSLKARALACAQALPETAMGLMPALLGLPLIPFVMYFVLLRGPDVIEGFVKVCPSRHMEKVLSLICQIDEALGNYLRGLFLEAAVVSLLTWVGLWYLKVRYAWEIALLSGLTNMIPYLGPVAGGLAGGLVAFFQFQSVAMVLKVFFLAWVVQILDNWVVQPLILREAVEIHPVLLILSLMIGGQLLGFFGLLFAVPAVCILKEAGRVVYDWYVAESGAKKTSFSLHALRIPFT